MRQRSFAWETGWRSWASGVAVYRPIERVNQAAGQRPCAIICDEFGTVRTKSMLNTYATARSNNMVPILAVQDLRQLRAQYTQDEANIILKIGDNLFCGQTGGDTDTGHLGHAVVRRIRWNGSR